MTLFHGSDREILDAVLPAKVLGRKSNYALRTVGNRSVGGNAYATKDENYAWEAAQTAARAHGGRARVYEVAPHPEQRPGLYNSEHPRFTKNHPRADLQEYVAPHFNVTDRRDIKPGHQGTFPQLNWKQFARPNTGVGPGGWEDANHPDDDEREHGHGGGQMRRDYYLKYSDDALAASQHHRDLQTIKDMQAERAAGREQGELF